MTQASTAAAYRNNSSSMKNFAPYANVEQSWGNWNFDAVSATRRKKRASPPRCSRPTISIRRAEQPRTPQRQLRSGAFFTHDYNLSATVWTAAANYKFNNHFSAYARYVDAYRMPQNDDFLNAARATVTNAAYNSPRIIRRIKSSRSKAA